MKCRNCKCNGFLTDDNGEQFSWCERFGDNLDIDEERVCRGYVPATNADRIRAMTDEELAERLAEIANGVDGSCAPGCYDCTGKTCASAWLDWLREADNG